MLNLKTTVNVPTEVSIELETPAFFKSPMTSYKEYMAVIDESTIEILWLLDGTNIKNNPTENRIKEIKNALDNWEHISEEEFFEALDKALKDFNFKPSLRVITAKEGSEVTI